MSLSLRTPRSGCPATIFQSSQLASPAPAPAINDPIDHEEEDAAVTSPTKNIVPTVGAAEDLASPVMSSDVAAHNLLSIKSTTITANTFDDSADIVAPKPDSVCETITDGNIVTVATVATVAVDASADNINKTTVIDVVADVVATINLGWETVADSNTMSTVDVSVVRAEEEEAVVVMDTVPSQKDDESHTPDAPIPTAVHHPTSFTTAAGVPILLLSGLDADGADVTRRPFASPRQQLDDDSTNNDDVVMSSLTTPSKSSQRHHYYHTTTPSAPTKPAREVDCMRDDEEGVSDRMVCIQLFASECDDAEEMEDDLPVAATTSTNIVEGSQGTQSTAARRELFPSMIAAAIGSKRGRSETPIPQVPEDDECAPLPTPTTTATTTDITGHYDDDNHQNTSPLYSQPPHSSTASTPPLPDNTNDTFLPSTPCTDATTAADSGAADAQVDVDEDHPTPLLAPAPENGDHANTTTTIDNTANLVNPPSGFSVGGRPLDDDIKFIMDTSSKEEIVVTVEERLATPHTALTQDVIEGPCDGVDADADDVVVVEDAALLPSNE